MEICGQSQHTILHLGITSSCKKT